MPMHPGIRRQLPLLNVKLARPGNGNGNNCSALDTRSRGHPIHASDRRSGAATPWAQARRARDAPRKTILWYTPLTPPSPAAPAQPPPGHTRPGDGTQCRVANTAAPPQTASSRCRLISAISACTASSSRKSPSKSPGAVGAPAVSAGSSRAMSDGQAPAGTPYRIRMCSSSLRRALACRARALSACCSCALSFAHARLAAFTLATSAICEAPASARTRACSRPTRPAPPAAGPDRRLPRPPRSTEAWRPSPEGPPAPPRGAGSAPPFRHAHASARAKPRAAPSPPLTRPRPAPAPKSPPACPPRRAAAPSPAEAFQPPA
eukprot:scaffold34129_cov112-Isochrysis_galbana.AAC.6